MLSSSEGSPSPFHNNCSFSVDRNRFMSNCFKPTISIHSDILSLLSSSGDLERYVKKAEARRDDNGISFISLFSSSTCSLHLSCSPFSFPTRFSAARIVSSSFSTSNLSRAASVVRPSNLTLISATFLSSCSRPLLSLSSLCSDCSRLDCKLACSLSSGPIFSSTDENLTVALTQEARGRAAALARFATLSSKELLFFSSNCWTLVRISGVIFLTSKLIISSFTSLLPRKVLMLLNEVSYMPIMHRTPSSMSLIAVGGTCSARISASVAGFMLPTAFFA